MPAVGMRRSTRVFGVVMKGGHDSARVLRSGRRLWPENSVEPRSKRGNEGDDWSKPHTPKKAPKNDVVLPKTTPEKAPLPTGQRKRGRDGDDRVDRRFGIVYRRKRWKRMGAASSSLELSRKKEEGGESESGSRSVFSVVVKPGFGESDRFSRLLVLVLRYIKRVGVTLPELLAFFLSQPIHGTFSSRGVQFLQGSPTANTGICQFFGISQFIPLFSVDFSAVPVYFEYLHSAMHLNSLFRSFFLVHNRRNVDSEVEDEDVEAEIDFPQDQNKLRISCDAFEREPSETGIVTREVIEINDSLSLHSPAKGTRAAGRNAQCRNIMISRGIQKRRSSLRKRKARNPSTVSLRRSNRVVAASDLMGGRKGNSQLSGAPSSKKQRSLANGSTTGSLKEASSAMVDSTEGLDSSVCSANILVTESDLCYRIDGAIVTLEMSASREWLLTVRKDGLTRCTFKAEKVMRPSSSNRFTHAIMLSLDNGWKLEFANRQDWIVFRDLYKRSSDRNVPGPVAKSIPVPGVREVSSYAESHSSSFRRPDTYISVFGDEITRAMARRTANYDMDSEDEEWLRKLNNEFQEHVSEDNFELIIDALEKVYYYNSDDSFDVKSAASSCQDLGSKEVVEAVCTYWMSKRKQKRSLLIRVFQSHQSKKAPLIPKPLLRKRRSFKRQPSQFGRGNQPSVLKAIAAEQDALEENAMHRIEEAKASAKATMEIAIQKRRRAQCLTENADLATYKAAMLIKIAEAALATESVEAATGYFLD